MGDRSGVVDLERPVHGAGIGVIALLIPITGLSLTTVAIPLISYNLLILSRNTLAGLDSVDPDVKEAARGMGFAHGSCCGRSRRRWRCR